MLTPPRERREDPARERPPATQRLHPEPYRTYVVDRNINYANYCTAKCIFCNFKADPPGMDSGRADLPAGYVLTHEPLDDGQQSSRFEPFGPQAAARTHRCPATT